MKRSCAAGKNGIRDFMKRSCAAKKNACAIL